VISGTLGELRDSLKDRAFKGEIVLLVSRAEAVEASAEDLDTALDAALATMTVKDAAAHVAKTLGMQKRQVYQQALERSKAQKNE
jgi:16S rRNA (cytidine1402-2'-O)-methyltransferase